jgi:hypothetical protein
MNLTKMMTPAALAMALAFCTAGTASAQHQDHRGRSQDNARAQDARPQSTQPQRALPQAARQPQVQPQPQAQPQRGRTEQAVPRTFNQAPRGNVIQPQQDVRRDDRSRGSDNRAFDNRGSNNRGFDNRGFNNRGSDNRGFDNRQFSAPIVRERFYNPRVIFPRVYRPGFSLGFGVFFGRPLPYRYAYPAYGYGYGSVVPATSYGAITFRLNPGNAAVYVDGNYVGIAESFDDDARPLTLTAGTHRIELDAPGYEPVAFDVDVVPGQLIPYEGTLQPAY